MKKSSIHTIISLVTAFFIYFLPVCGYCESSDSFMINAPDKYVRNHAFNAPDNISDNIYKLTKYLTKPFKSDYDKLKVIAYWIASHIAYDGYKYSNGAISYKELNVKYDILQAKTGICEDFAKLFKKMANIANVNDVEVVYGYVLKNQSNFKRTYRNPKTVGHAWNKVTLGNKKFFVDTTFMAQAVIGENKNKFQSTLKHKLEVRKRTDKKTPVYENINDFYFHFTPRKEFNQFHSIHVLNKYIRN